MIKSERELEMHDVAPPSTRMSKESESKMTLDEDWREGAAAWARATPALIADRAKILRRRDGCKGCLWRASHQAKFHLQKR